jgi:hypothetical protein
MKLNPWAPKNEGKLTVANSDKENSQLTQTAKAESSNPALTPTANPKTTTSTHSRPLPTTPKPNAPSGTCFA